MKRALILTLNELKLFFEDKADLAFSLLLPIVIFTLMYFGFSGETMFNGTANIVNKDEGGVYATELLERLSTNDTIELKYFSEDAAETRLERSDLLSVLYIPDNFSADIIAGKPAELIILQRGNGGQEGQIIAGIVNGIISKINLELQAVRQVSTTLESSDIQSAVIEPVVQKYLQQEAVNPAVFIKSTSVGSSPDMVNQFLPGVINMFVLFSISMSARMIVEEKKRGTLERLLTTRLSVGEMFTGKFLANITRGFIQTLILLALAYAVFQIFTPLSFVVCLLIALVFAGAATGIGMLIASIARTGDAATWIAVFFTMAMVMLGGSFFEISEGTTLYTLSRFSLVTYANEAFRTVIAENGSVSDIGMELLILAGVFIIGLLASRLLFKMVPGGK